MNFAKFLRTSFDRTPPDDCFFCLSVNCEGGGFSEHLSYRVQPKGILILQRCRSGIALDITIILLIYCKWNTWWCQFSISVWHRDLDIGPIRPLMSSWHHHDCQRYPAQRNPLGSCTTWVSAAIMPRLYCDTGNYSFRRSFSQLLLRKICKITPSNAALLKNNF